MRRRRSTPRARRPGPRRHVPGAARRAPAGRGPVVIGRASDFVGPGVRDSAFGEFIFEPALVGKRAQTMGRPDTQHTYSYVPNVGRNLVLLGAHEEAYGRVWHLPNPPTRTTRHIIIDVYAAAGMRRTDVTTLSARAASAGAVQPQRPRAAAHLLPVRRAVRRRRLSVPRRSAATPRAGTTSSPAPSTGTAPTPSSPSRPTVSQRPQPRR